MAADSLKLSCGIPMNRMKSPPTSLHLWIHQQSKNLNPGNEDIIIIKSWAGLYASHRSANNKLGFKKFKMRSNAQDHPNKHRSPRRRIRSICSTAALGRAPERRQQPQCTDYTRNAHAFALEASLNIRSSRRTSKRPHTAVGDKNLEIC